MRADAFVGKTTQGLLSMPPAVLRRIAGPPKHSDRGEPLDLQMQAMLALAERIGGPKPPEIGAVKARQQTERDSRRAEPEPMPVARVRDEPAQGGRLPLRFYEPGGIKRPAPLLLYYHGGGWSTGSIDSHDGVCRALANDARCIVVSAGYRLAPEHPFPAGLDDAIAAFEEVQARAEDLGSRRSWVAVGGDSAGGNLATEVALYQRAQGRPVPAHQLLIYPGVDLTRSGESHRTFAHGFFLEGPTMDWFIANYVPDSELRRDPRVSPLFAPDLSGLPPATLVTAGFDPLRDEGEAYAERLRNAGVSVDHHQEPGLVHGFVNMAIVEAARTARRRLALALGSRLSRLPAEDR